MKKLLMSVFLVCSILVVSSSVFARTPISAPVRKNPSSCPPGYYCLEPVPTFPEKKKEPCPPGYFCIDPIKKDPEKKKRPCLPGFICLDDPVEW